MADSNNTDLVLLRADTKFWGAEQHVLLQTTVLAQRSPRLAEYIRIFSEYAGDGRGGFASQLKILQTSFTPTAFNTYVNIVLGEPCWPLEYASNICDAHNMDVGPLEAYLQIYDFARETDDFDAIDAVVDAVKQSLVSSPDDHTKPLYWILGSFPKRSLAWKMLVDAVASPELAAYYLHDNGSHKGWLNDVKDADFLAAVGDALWEKREQAADARETDDDDAVAGDEDCEFHLHVALGKPCYKESLQQ